MVDSIIDRRGVCVTHTGDGAIYVGCLSETFVSEALGEGTSGSLQLLVRPVIELGQKL